MQYIDKAGKMGLLKYSSGEFLDNLAALKKVERNPAKQAETVLRFTLSAAQQQVIGIPKGTRVKGRDLFFATEEYGEIPAEEMSVDVYKRQRLSLKTGFTVFSSCRRRGSGGNQGSPKSLYLCVEIHPYLSLIHI